MIELPPKFKQALGNGVRTSLYPLVRIYQGYRIDDIIPDDAESINLSIKETNIGGSAYKPLLLNTPSIKSSADIVNNKYTISSVSLSISNAPFQGKIFSDDIQSLLNAVCQVYYCANGIDSIGDCLLVYTGTIRRFNQSAETIKLTLEDATQQILSTKIPTSTVPDEEFYKEADIGEPYPMVYGYVDKSPVIARSLGHDSMGDLEEELTKFHIDKRGIKVGGLWKTPNLEDYGNEFLDVNHPLIENGYIKEVGALSAYEDGFVPIPQYLDYDEPWSYYVGGISDSTHDDYNQITLSLSKIYDFEQSGGEDSSASIKIIAEALINEIDISGLPTRIYRPIDKVECFTYCDDNPSQGGVGVHSLNRIFGFTGYSTTSVGSWIPWEKAGNVVSSNDTSAYDDHFTGEGWINDWWEPTLCNNNDDGGDTSSVDVNWKNNYGTRGFFPVDRLQDGGTDKGMYLCGRNADGERTGAAYKKTGMAAIKLIFKDNVGNLPCSTKIIYDAEYHSFNGMDLGYNWWDNVTVCYPASFWTGESIPEFHGLVNRTASTLMYGYGGNDFPYVPDGDTSDYAWNVVTDFADDQSGTEETIRIINGYGEALTFTNTTSFDNIKFGIEQFGIRGGDQGNDTGYVAIQLFNFYLLQDAVVDQPLNKKFFADVKGRVIEEGEKSINIPSIEHISTGGPGSYTHSIFYTSESVSGTAFIGESFDFYNSVSGNYIGTFTFIDILSDSITAYAPELAAPDYSVGIIKYQATSTPLTASQILKNILEEELNYKPDNVELIDEIDTWQHSFTLNEQKEAKEVFEGLFKSSLIIPSFNAGGQFTFIPLHQVLDNVSYTTIDNQDLLKYSFSLTKLDDVKNSVNVKYKKNYGSGEFDKETGYKLIDANDNEYENLDEITRAIYPADETKSYSIDYYGLTSEEAKLEVETDYIRDDDTARKLQKRLLMWYANQHLIAKIDLPASYMNLEVGDYIHINELIGGKKAFGYDYTISGFKNGQIVYAVFFITKISKSLDKVSIEAIQVHRGEYGEPDEDIIIEEDTEIITDGGGNSGQGNWELGDPNDNPNYGDDTIVEEEPEEEYTEDPYLNVTWLDGNNDLNTNPQAIISTNIEGEFEYEALIIYNDEVFEYGTNYEMPIITEDDEPYNATDYINVVINTTNNSEGNIQGGNITLSTQYLIPGEVLEDGTIESHNGISGVLRIFYEGTAYSIDLSFQQSYVPPIPPVEGDVNGDGIVNILDVVRLVQLVTQPYNYTANEIAQGDINEDGTTDILDVVILVQIVLAGG